MITINKIAEQDFVILNLTDTHFHWEDSKEGISQRHIFEYTVQTLIEQVNPDLITITGDLAWAGFDQGYEDLGSFLNRFQIPWAPVWGNHDNQDGPEYVKSLVQRFEKFSHFTYESGPEELGNGNYVITICENEKIVEGLIMLDSHDRTLFTDSAGKTDWVWTKLSEKQLEWYEAQINLLKSQGCLDTTMFLHIPIFAYQEAYVKSIRPEFSPYQIPADIVTHNMHWYPHLTGCTGAAFEPVSCYPVDDGVFERIEALDSTHHIIAGHDHVNFFSLPYHGVKLIYGLKAGPGAYWHPNLNGGTVIRIGTEGVKEVTPLFVSVDHLL